ncbi:MAG TPA: hypothetical protein VLJ11_13325 [Bryobacteraceae bacterium]|nr:hypothetical protein [Bryobacteraceae bacterium]
MSVFLLAKTNARFNVGKHSALKRYLGDAVVSDRENTGSTRLGVQHI